jgi:hypothetical protein
MYCGESFWWSAALPNGCAVWRQRWLERSHGIFIIACKAWVHGGTRLDGGIDIIVVLVSVSIPNRVRKRQLPSSHSSQQPPPHSSHLNERAHQARKASSTALGPSPLRFHHRLRRKVRGARSTAANMPAVQEVAYQSRPCPLTSFLSRPSIPMSPCPIKESATRPDLGIACRNPYAGLG